MVDDLVVANATTEEHRASMLRVFTRLARRQHSIKLGKLNILQAEARYLGHISTEEGLKPTGEHVTATTEMPYPAYEDGTVNMTSLRSFIGMCKYLRRYLKDCAKHCMKLNGLLCNGSGGKWPEAHAQAWDALKHDAATTKGVWHPNYHHPPLRLHGRVEARNRRICLPNDRRGREDHLLLQSVNNSRWAEVGY